MGFLDFSLLDFIDIALVALLIYQLYRLVKGTVAINIFVGVIAIYLLWKLVEALQMELLSEILGQFIGVGVIALLIVFQQELRKFLLIIGTTGFKPKKGSFFGSMKWAKNTKSTPDTDIESILLACKELSQTYTGALIVINRNSKLRFFVETGDAIEAPLSVQLLKSIFYKNSPLHDGAVIISGNRIEAARCVLPVSDNPKIPARYGMRHRASIGITEQSDAISIAVSEETGELSYAKEGHMKSRLTIDELKSYLEADFH
jgi:diadenylate cyclase